MDNEIAAKEKGELLINILHNFDIEAQLIDTHIGPSVTQFEIKPDASVKVSKILSLADNIKMALAAKDVRIEAPIPGRNAVGIEIPNVKSTPVKLREIISNVSEKDKKQPLLFFVGKDLLGQTVTNISLKADPEGFELSCEGDTDYASLRVDKGDLVSLDASTDRKSVV